MKKQSKRSELYLAIKTGQNITLPLEYVRHFGLFGRLALIYPRLGRAYTAVCDWLDTMNGTRIIIMR